MPSPVSPASGDKAAIYLSVGYIIFMLKLVSCATNQGEEKKIFKVKLKLKL
jgi:hypothetical protein